MPLSFEPIDMDRQHEYLQHLAACSQRASDYSFINLWGWSEAHNLEWAWEKGLVWIRQERPAPVYWAPVGNWSTVDWSDVIPRHFAEGVAFARVPEKLAGMWSAALGDRIRTEEARGQWDYLYRAEDLSRLAGNRFHKKKNLVNQFRRRYEYRFLEMGVDTVHMAAGMQEDWCLWRDCESHDTLTAENGAIDRVLRSWDRLEGVIGGALIVDGGMVAYTVGERLDGDTLLIHFEKANPEFKGAYQAINQTFAAHLEDDFRLVNREQDLDDEGLRRAKMSYQPVDFLKKFRIAFR